MSRSLRGRLGNLARRIGPPLIALSLGLVLSLVLGELAVRWLRPPARLVIAPAGFYQPDPPGRYRLAPGYRGRITNRAEYDNRIAINQAGLRGPELETDDPRLRILALGDSFTFGVGVEVDETWVARLAESLSARGVPAAGLNAGTPAFGVPDAELWFRLHGAELEPDLVILAVFLGNDLIDAAPDREEILVVDGLLVPEESPRGLRAWLFRHSQLYVTVKKMLEAPALRPFQARLGLGEPWTTRVLRQELDVYRRGAEERLSAAVEATDRALGRLAAAAQEGSFELLALLIPSEIQVDPERWREAVAALELEAEEYDPEIPTRIFRRLLARHRVPVVEPAPELAAAIRAGEQVYFRQDRHWTEAGHRIAAKALAERIAAGDGGDAGENAGPES